MDLTDLSIFQGLYGKTKKGYIMKPENLRRLMTHIRHLSAKKNKFKIRLFYSWSMTLGCKEIHVDLTVLSVFQKAVTFDHNFT